ncbi:glycosyl transferase family 90-domain-containing protein [Coniochaeta sp. 2T2.1]|nr:glycosyl transferase family 90-domain-containing protein [Coniochaeta sp. 2T2.1]
MGEKLRVRRSRRLRQATLLLGGCLALYCLFFISKSPVRNAPLATRKPWTLPPELLNNLSLDEEHCNAAFPGLTKEIDDAVAQGPFTLKQKGDSGPVQGRIKDGQLYIIHAQRRADLSTEMLNSRTAALHQLHRALLTSPTPLPNTIFSLNFQDSPFGTSWTYSRPADPSQSSLTARNFLMPHFSFWSWPLPFIGSFSRAASAISSIESSLSFADKIPRAVWRGTVWFNSVHNPRLRQNLLKAARERTWDWADIEALRWEKGNATNAVRVEDFCRWRYVVHTEGIAYSGRFQFLQMCGSVVVTTPIVWMQHTTHLVRPVWSGRLLEGEAWKLSERMRRSWPRDYGPEEANIVFVKPDWSDLEDVIGWLEEHVDVAEGIARRQRDLFVGGGYFSPAAEVCYWRALVRGWAKVVKTDGEGWEEHQGAPFETFALGNGD